MNVSHHYDIKDDLYDLFLDPKRQYSCAYFKNENDTLETAQNNKIKHIIKNRLKFKRFFSIRKRVTKYKKIHTPTQIFNTARKS